MTQRTVLAPIEDVLQGRGEVLTVAGEMVRGQGLPDGLPDEVYEWARVRAFRLANAIDRQVRVEHYDLKAPRVIPVEEHRDDPLTDSTCEKSPDGVHCQHWFEEESDPEKYLPCCWCNDRACDLECEERA